MGWIETYMDPEHIRAYYEGFVAIVDKDRSKKFGELVTASQALIPKLPWPKVMEKEKFMAPDFTALEVICFACKSCPAGINIPNYDDIRQNDGFKNLFLNNSVNAKLSGAAVKMKFATEEQAETLKANSRRCYEAHVACHELLGHGSGKLIYRSPDGSATKFTDPLNGEVFESCYEEGETWKSKFNVISTSYEECRADTCGFHLVPNPEVYEIFGF